MDNNTFISLFKASIIALLVLVALAIVTFIYVGIAFPFEDPVPWPPTPIDGETEYYLPNEDIHIKSIIRQGKYYIAFSSEPFIDDYTLSEFPDYIQILRPYDHLIVYFESCSHRILLSHAPGVLDSHFSNFEHTYLGAGIQVLAGIVDADNGYNLRPGYIGMEYDDTSRGSLLFYDSEGRLSVLAK